MKASEYRKLAKASDTDGVFDLTLPSGAVFKVKRPPSQQWILAGRLPSSLAEKLTGIQDSSGGVDLERAQKTLSPGETIKMLEFGRDLLLYAVVEPKISIDPQGEEEIAPEDILPEDFNFLYQWAMSGGEEAKVLENFREEGQRAPVAGDDGEQLPPETVELDLPASG